MKEEKSSIKILPKIRKKLTEHSHPEWIVETEYVTDVLKDMQKIIGKKGSIFQPGCGCGYVLDALWEAGYRNLTGLDRNKGDNGDWNPNIKFIHSTIGKLVDYDGNSDIKDPLDILPQYDVVLCHRFLHVFPDNSERIFEKIAQKSRRFLIILEGEEGGWNQFWHHYKRNYKEVFEKYGFEQIFEEVNLFPFQNWEIKTMVLRVFKRI